MKKKIIYAFILVGVVICGFMVVISQTIDHNCHPVKTHLGVINYKLIQERVSMYELTPGSYTSSPFEYPIDIYMTYYSVKLLEELGYSDLISDLEYTVMALESVGNLSELSMLSELSAKYSWGNEIKNTIFAELMQYKKDKGFVLYPTDTIAGTFDSLSVFALYHATKCVSRLDLVDYGNVIDDMMIDEMQKYVATFLESEPADVCAAMDIAYQLIYIYDYLKRPVQPLLDYVRDYYEPYVASISRSVMEGKTEIIFQTETYWYLTEKLKLKDELKGINWVTIIAKMQNGDGGYSLFEGHYPDPQIMLRTIYCCKKYGCLYDGDEICRIVLRHRGIGNYFIAFTLFGESFTSSYFASKINHFLSEKGSSALVSNATESDLGRFSTEDEDLGVDQSYIDSVSARGYVTGAEIEKFSFITEQMKQLRITDLRPHIETFINDCIDQRRKVPDIDMSSLLDALYVYHSLWGGRKYQDLLSDVCLMQPGSLGEAYSFTRILESIYSSSKILYHISQEQYDCIVRIIDELYDPEAGLFFYDTQHTLADMQSIYYGVYLAGVYYAEAQAE